VYNGTYNFAENRVIDSYELEGLEAVNINGDYDPNATVAEGNGVNIIDEVVLTPEGRNGDKGLGIEIDILTDDEFEKRFLNNNSDISKIEVLDTDNDGKLDVGVLDGDTIEFFLGRKISLVDKVAKPESAVPSATKMLLKRLLGIGAGQMLSTQGLNVHEDGLIERRLLGLPGNASQREVDSVKIVNFLNERKNQSSPIEKN